MAEIVRTEGVLGGDPRIEGTRIGVLHVHELVAQGTHSPVDVADQLDISLGEVYSALAYYHEHPDQMREVRRTHDDAESTLREESLSPRNRRSSDGNPDRRARSERLSHDAPVERIRSRRSHRRMREGTNDDPVWLDQWRR